MQEKINIGVLGASGYTGTDLVRLLSCHPNANIVLLTANQHAGQKYGDIYPAMHHLNLPLLTKIENADWQQCDVVFCGLPHGTTQQYMPDMIKHAKIIDLSADFRLRNGNIYQEWYGQPHIALEQQKHAIYGLTEFYRDDIKNANLVACPGCYPTAALLALLPLLKQNAITPNNITIDAKSGVTGAGRSIKQANLFCEIADGMAPYGITRHRHMPEIEQELSRITKQDINISFTPHLVPMNRGELVTIYVEHAPHINHDDIYNILQQHYENEYFIHVAEKNHIPATRHVRGSNFCLINAFEDRIIGRSIIIATIDNLVKGSSGQAIQNMNVMFSLPENTALQQLPLFP